MAQCCQSIQLPPVPLPESLVYGLQKKNYKKFKKHKKKLKMAALFSTEAHQSP